MIQRSRPVLAALLLAAAAVSVSAANFWDEKPFREWSAEEAGKLLTDSPWAKTVEVLAQSMSERAGALRPAARGNTPPSVDPSRGMGRASIQGGAGPTAASVQATRSVKVRMRWVSALPVRQAVAVQQFGAEAANSAEAVKMMLAKSEHYVLGLTGLDKQDLKGDPEKLKSITALKIRKQEPLTPIHVQVAPSQDGQEIYLFFPKAKDGGHDITLDDKNIEVEIKLDAATIRRGFKLADMVYYDQLQI